MTPTIIITSTPEGYILKFSKMSRDNFGDAIDTLKRTVPPHQRAYAAESKTWFVSTAGRTYLDAWLGHMRVAHGASVEWVAGDETSSDAHERAHKPHTPAKADPFATLHLLPSAPPEVVKAAYRALSLKHHPDLGGDVRAMQTINAAYRQLSPAA
jgi:hypothetical protein